MLGADFQTVQCSVRETQTKLERQNCFHLIKLLSVSLSSGCILHPDLSLYLLQETMLGLVAMPACSALTCTSSQSLLVLNTFASPQALQWSLGSGMSHSRFHLLMFQLARQVQFELKAGRRQSCFPYSLMLSLPLKQPDREQSQLKS